MPEAKVKAAGAAIKSLLTDVRMTGRGLKPAMVIYGPEKSGKTSLAAWSKNPIFAMSSNETGLETLIDYGQLGETANMPAFQSWEEFLKFLDRILVEEHNFETLVLDTLNGFEKMAEAFVTTTEFGGDTSKRGFLHYMVGYKATTPHWSAMLNLLDQIREEKGMTIIGLCHQQVHSFKNPTGQDYDRYQPQMHERQWGATHQWADLIMFLDTVTVVDEEGSRPKAKGGPQRIARCQKSATWDAGNRYGIKEFSLGNSAEEGWKNFIAAMQKARKK